mmetsp:Transcript_514/g.1836  ORF Transcript_514/g.1836 Transcript_514/m.1836 type:complete len:226 (+) Transcript_514:462-1139(+)
MARGHHLVGEEAEAPPVDGPRVAFLEEHLRGHVSLSPAVGPRRREGASEGGARRPRPGGVFEEGYAVSRQRFASGEVACEAEICEESVALGVHEYVLRLEVPIDDVHVVEVLQSQGDFREVHPGPAFVEAPEPPQKRKEVTALGEVHHHVQLRHVLEGEPQLHDVGVVRLLDDPSFRPRALDLPPSPQFRLFKDLHRVHLPIGLLPDLHHRPEASAAQDGHELEV